MDEFLLRLGLDPIGRTTLGDVSGVEATVFALRWCAGIGQGWSPQHAAEVAEKHVGWLRDEARRRMQERSTPDAE